MCCPVPAWPQQTVAWMAGGGHWGGYTYRLCRLPAEGRTGITEECFAENILKATKTKTILLSS